MRAANGGFTTQVVASKTRRRTILPAKGRPDTEGAACGAFRNILCSRIATLFFILGTFFPMAAAAADDYGYPIPGAFEATILGTPKKLMPTLPAKMRSRELLLEVIPGREKPPVFFWDKGLHCTFAYQEHKAPLIFLIAGTGASDRAPAMLTVTRALYQAGFHVITLPSPTNANFVISASQNSVPGDLAEDSADLYRAMEAAWNEVKGDIEVSSFSLGGYSLGGSEAAFVAKLDEERRLFKFRKVLMIDPPVNLYTSVTRVEALLKRIPGGAKREGVFFNNMLSKFSNFYNYGNFIAINDNFLYAVYKEGVFSQEETGGLIGLTFRLNLAGMIFASDVMTNSGYVVPKNRVLKYTDSLFDYFLVSTHLSFFDYFDEYFYPYFLGRHPGLSKQAFIASQDLRSIEGYLKSSAKFGLMANENDFLLSREDLDYLRQIFGPRARIYPRGGHLGNLEYKENVDYMIAFFKE